MASRSLPSSAEDGIRRVFAAFRGGDPRALFEVIAEDAVWTVNGTVPVAQVYEGRARIFELFRETRRLTGGTYLSTLKWFLADDEHAVAVYRAQGRREGRELDIDQVLLIDHTDGVWTSIVAIPSDPPAFERFWA
ncbi:MAG TPA: nuclear transport factor 2 family protein [Gaiellaceae bacterium]|jgi:ketosteroid isomerase-like protein|nr:nuclear transport factor 2 family protein [Gaiellaceae bacterium]